MKTCQACGHANADDMRFCLECGKPLPDAPIVFDLQGGSSLPGGGPQTNPYGQPTNLGGGPGFQQQPFQQPQQFSMVPPPKSRGGGKKVFVIVGGIFALIFLVFAGIAGIVAYNLMKSEDTVVKNSPTPTASPKTSETSTPKKSESPKPSEVSTPKTDNSGDVKATPGKVWADFNVKEGGKTGMRVHAQFTVYNLKGTELYLALYFQEEDGTPLTTTNKKYASSNGDVAVFEAIKPGFDEAYYEDVDLFIPYDEFRLSKGKYNLRVDASVIYKAGGLVDHLEYFPFQYEKF